MIRRSAGNDVYFVERAQKVRVPFQFIQHNTIAVLRYALAHSITNRLWLLVNLFQHEMLIAALFRRLGIPTDLKDLLVNDFARTIFYNYRIFFDYGQFPIANYKSATRTSDNSWYIGSDKILAIPQAYNQWIVLLGTNKLVGVFF